MKQINIPAFVAGLVLIGMATGAFSTGHPIWGSAGVLGGLCGVIDSLQWVLGNRRSRPWGKAPMPEERRVFGDRLIFEPTCLYTGCGGPVVDFVGGEVPRKIRSMTGPPFDDAVPNYFTSGAAVCRRCRRTYIGTISGGTLKLQSSDRRLHAIVDPL